MKAIKGITNNYTLSKFNKIPFISCLKISHKRSTITCQLLKINTFTHLNKFYRGTLLNGTADQTLKETKQMSSNQIYKNILVYEANPKVLVIQLNREHVKNAVDKETADELYNAFTVDFEKNNDYSVAILYGGENTFCSGADLKNISKGALNLVEPPSETNIGPMGPTRLELSKPVIAAIGSGYAVAGGMELACFCDLRVCKEDSKFGIFCRRFGVPLIDGGTIRLPALIGLSRAMDLILTGREISGEEAFSIGFVNRLIKSDENVLQKAIELANQLAQFPQDCMRNDRLSTLKYIYNNLNEHLQNEYLFGMKSLQSEEFQKGVEKFTKRKPNNEENTNRTSKL
ncbi:hypothetical protein ABK040_011990 [Willaertia magna]